jgi:hypothetical protein
MARRDQPKTSTSCRARLGENLERLAGALRELGARLRVAGMTDEEARQLPVVLDGPTLAAFGSTT